MVGGWGGRREEVEVKAIRVVVGSDSEEEVAEATRVAVGGWGGRREEVEVKAIRVVGG